MTLAYKVAVCILLLGVLVLTRFQLVRAQDGTWISLASMPTARKGLMVGVIDGKIYAIGGSNGTYLDVNEEYDPATNTWTIKQPSPTPVSYGAAAVYENQI